MLDLLVWLSFRQRHTPRHCTSPPPTDGAPPFTDSVRPREDQMTSQNAQEDLFQRQPRLYITFNTSFASPKPKGHSRSAPFPGPRSGPRWAALRPGYQSRRGRRRIPQKTLNYDLQHVTASRVDADSGKGEDDSTARCLLVCLSGGPCDPPPAAPGLLLTSFSSLLPLAASLASSVTRTRKGARRHSAPPGVSRASAAPGSITSTSCLSDWQD